MTIIMEINLGGLYETLIKHNNNPNPEIKSAFSEIKQVISGFFTYLYFHI